MAKRKGCSVQTVKIRRKGRKNIIAEFRARVGPTCGPRRKPSTAKIRKFQPIFKKAAKACHQSSRRARNACVASKFKSILRSA